MIAAIAAAAVSAALAQSYPATITVTQGGQHLADFHLPLTAGKTTRDYSGSDVDLTTVWLTPSQERDGRVKLHIVTERARKDASARQVSKTSSDIILNADHGRFRIKMNARAGEGDTEIVVALGDGTSPALAVPSAASLAPGLAD